MKIIIGLLLLFSEVCMGSDSGSLEIWVYSLYPSTITRNKVQPFIDHLEQETGATYSVDVNSDDSGLLEKCGKGSPALVFSSLPIGRKVAKKCGYSYIAVSYQNIFLYTRRGTSVTSLDNIKKVGVITNIEASEIAAREFFELDKRIQIIEYSSFYNLIKNYRKDKIGGAVFAEGTLALAYNFQKNWVPVYEFKERGVASVMVSPFMDSKTKSKITNTLLGNNTIVSKVFQEDFGLGRFQPPNTLKNRVFNGN